jgi:hypothetical protein
VTLGNLESVRVLLRHNANVGKESHQGWAGTVQGRGSSLETSFQVGEWGAGGVSNRAWGR